MNKGMSIIMSGTNKCCGEKKTRKRKWIENDKERYLMKDGQRRPHQDGAVEKQPV